jgi:hypothetical protein
LAASAIALSLSGERVSGDVEAIGVVGLHGKQQSELGPPR